MHTTEPNYHPQPHTEGELHETTDLSVKAIAITISAGAAVVLFTLVGVYWLFFAFGEIDRRFLDNPPQTAIKTPKIQPREPRIQGIPGYHTNLDWQDLAEMKRVTSAELSAYGRTENTDFVHIPVTEAMQQIAIDGTLKTRENPSIPNQRGASDVAP
ncbi:MAG TPA: hypothetical protein VGG19_15325 [Tepidisphaeraceae bacterium]|jgi:hypothetical protein